jgi:MFS family permease
MGRGRAESAVSLRELFGVAEFRPLFSAYVASVAGDQLARIALTVLVFSRTGSAALTGLTYALTVLPVLVGGPLLSGLADRWPRRPLMVGCDLARAGLVAAMVVPGLSLWLLGALVVLVQLLESPFDAARAATQALVLQGEHYVLASAISNLTYRLASAIGFGVGGGLVALIGARSALLIDAGTFLLSALLVRSGVRSRAAPGDSPAGEGWWPSLRSGFRLVTREPRLRSLVALACLTGCYMTAVGLAVPYAHQFGGGPVAAGLLMAANPVGQSIGMIVTIRWVSMPTRMRWLGPLAIGSCLPLVLCLAAPGVAGSFALWVLSGLGASYQLAANAAFVQTVPDAQRGQAFGLAMTAMLGAQGVGILVAGVAADHWSPSTVVGTAGLVGTIAAVVAALAWRRANIGSIPAVEAHRTPPSAGRVTITNLQ